VVTPTIPPPAAPAMLPPIPVVASVPEPPRSALPAQLPALVVPEVVFQDNKPKPPAEPKRESKSEPLPPPRPAPSEPVKMPPVDAAAPPAANPAWGANPTAAATYLDTRPALEPAPNLPGTLNGVPVRRHTFGSPPLRLSRDFAVRDAFGYDLASPEPPVRERLAGGLTSGSPDDLCFVEAEYLMWWGNRPRIPVLATTGPGPGPSFLGRPGTTNLFGPGTFGPSFRDGFRVRAGGWLDDCSGHGVDGSFFFLGRRGEGRAFEGFPVLVRPIFAPNFNAEFGEVVALPDLSRGSLTVNTDTFLWGADANYRCATCRTCDRTTAWFAGYRHLNLAESLVMTEFITATGPLANDPLGTRVEVQDAFRTYNRFHGGQVGWLAERRAGAWEVSLRMSVALGVNVQTLEIDGFQRRTRPGQPTESFRGGLLAAGPNLGSFTSTRFSVIPEATASLGYSVTPNLQLTVGYNFLYWNNVIRPGDQIDPVVDVTFVPNPPAGVRPSGQNRPQPPFRQSDFWVQGITLGARLRW
jgi:hypothetical protein